MRTALAIAAQFVWMSLITAVAVGVVISAANGRASVFLIALLVTNSVALCVIAWKWRPSRADDDHGVALLISRSQNLSLFSTYPNSVARSITPTKGSWPQVRTVRPSCETTTEKSAARAAEASRPRAARRVDHHEFPRGRRPASPDRPGDASDRTGPRAGRTRASAPGLRVPDPDNPIIARCRERPIRREDRDTRRCPVARQAMSDRPGLDIKDDHAAARANGAHGDRCAVGAEINGR